MNIHEYQAKELLAKFGVPVPAGHAAMSVDEAVAAAKQLPGPLWVVKAQIHAGGRGKGKFTELGPDAKGGVRLAQSIDEVRADAEEMLGKTLVTIQTGPEGKQVQRLYITDGVDIAKEFYLALLVDRETGRIAMVASTEGGMDIEAVAHDTPDKIETITIDPGDRADAAPRPRGRRGARPDRRPRQAGANVPRQALRRLRRHRRRADRDQSAGGHRRRQVAGARRQGRVRFATPCSATRTSPRLRDLSEEDPMEIEASKYDLAYIKLDGDIGCMVNGAGLAMATMDIIKLNGAFPANFLDVGGGASKEKVTAAFKIILSDPAVKGILVNIFGGIMNCDIIADGIVAAAREVNSRCRWWSGSKAPMSPRARRSSPIRACRSSPPTTLATRRARSSPKSKQPA